MVQIESSKFGLFQAKSQGNFKHHHTGQSSKFGLFQAKSQGNFKHHHTGQI